MNVIWKYPLTDEETEIEAPIEQFLTVQIQDGVPCVWAIVNPDKMTRKYKIALIGTGWECQRIDVSKYIGTVQDGMSVWHCFWDNISPRKTVNEPAFALFSSSRFQ